MKIIKIKNNIFNPVYNDCEVEKYKACLTTALYKCLSALKDKYYYKTKILYEHRFTKLENQIKTNKSTVHDYSYSMTNSISFYNIILKEYFAYFCMIDSLSHCTQLSYGNFIGTRRKIEALLKELYSNCIEDIKYKVYDNGDIIIEAVINEEVISLDYDCDFIKKYNVILYSLFCSRMRLESNDPVLIEDSIQIIVFLLKEINSEKRAKKDIQMIKNIKNILLTIGDSVIKYVKTTIGDQEILRIYPILKLGLTEEEIGIIIDNGNKALSELIKYILLKGEFKYIDSL